ncbi:MAG: sensor histidine kinase [Bryobacteraceae bacterium]|jgi:light-regulated signal transduction histidine kinase (bacteriophytochrome)
MNSTPKSVEQQLAEALRENTTLRESLESCLAARREAEDECVRNLELAQKANQELHVFSYAMSHDLKEPLRSLSAYADLLRRHYNEDQQAAEFTAFITDGVKRANALIDNLLTYSMTGAPTRRTHVNLNSAVQWALLNLEHSVKESGAQITFADLPVAIVDESQIVLVFQNLLLNSLRYRSGDVPVIHIYSEQGPDAYTISVRDNGIGIEPRYQQQIFTAFKRLHGRELAGTGLGLALCRKIVEGHGGRIWVESDGVHGSVFRFTLPI